MNNNNDNSNDNNNQQNNTRLDRIRDAETYDRLEPSTWNQRLIINNLTGATQQEYDGYCTRELLLIDDDHEKTPKEYTQDYINGKISSESHDQNMQEEDELYTQRCRDFAQLMGDVAQQTGHDFGVSDSSTDSDDNSQDDSNKNDNNQDDTNQNENSQDDTHQDNRNPTGQTPLEYVQDVMDAEPLDVSDPDG